MGLEAQQDSQQTPSLEAKSEIYEKAVALLAFREHGRGELKQKLMHKLTCAQQQPGLVDVVLDDLQARDWLNERRFAQSALRQKQASGHGPAKIRQWLAQRCEAPEVISEAMAIDQSLWVEIAMAALEKKYGPDYPEMAKGSQKQKQRMLRFLASRGFSHAQAFKAIESQ